MNDNPTQMNDEPTGNPGGSAGDAPGESTGGVGPLDDTQPIDVQRFAPTPDPRPDDRWAWAAPSATPPPDRWYEPAPSEPGPAVPGYAAAPGYTAGTFAPGGVDASLWARPAAPVAPPVAPLIPTAPAPAQRRGGSGIGTIVAVSLLSAVLASGGTVLILDRTGALDRPAAASGAGTVQQAIGQQPVTIDESSAVIDAAARVGPAVVKITVDGQSTDPFGSVPTEGVGSGIIYDASGWILTNRHVVTGADKLTVELKDGRKFAGTVYGIDTLTDLAIVKVDATGLPTAPIGHSDGLKIGQLVVAIGSPLGTYSFSVTSGIVSAKGRDIRVDNGTRISNLIQTDAAINPGNSGGPLADASGAVVGVNTAVATDSSGIGFAIPIDIARPIMEQALRGETLSRPWIGIRYQPINLQLKQALGLPVVNGALVSNTNGTDASVIVDGPAAKAGIQDGDIIVSINGTMVDQEHPLDALMVQYSPNETIALDILRNGAPMTVQVTLGTRPGNP
jgi:S1-C subfamily serine protease